MYHDDDDTGVDIPPGAAIAFVKVVRDIIQYDKQFSFNDRAMLFAIIDAEDPEERYSMSKDSMLLIQWLHDKGCPLVLDHARTAAQSALFDLLTWLRSKGCPIDSSIWRSYMENVQSEFGLQWAHDNGFDWKYKGICKHLTEIRYSEILQWSHDNGCHCTGHCKKYRHALCGKYVSMFATMARHRWMHVRTYAKAVGKLVLLLKRVRAAHMIQQADARKGVVEYVYILQLREFINTNVFKIGLSKQYNLGRFMQYPKGSVLYAQFVCNDCRTVENTIKRMFKKKYKQRIDYGIEYFEGNHKDMVNDICTIINRPG